MSVTLRMNVTVEPRRAPASAAGRRTRPLERMCPMCGGACTVRTAQVDADAWPASQRHEVAHDRVAVSYRRRLTRQGYGSGLPRRVRRRAGPGRRHDECGRDRGDSLTPAGQAQPVGRRRADRDRGAARRRQGRLRLGPPRTDARHGADHLHRHVADRRSRPHAPAAATSPSRATPEAPAHAGRSVPKHRAQVAEPGRRQQRVAAGVRGHVAVGVPERSRPARPGR